MRDAPCLKYAAKRLRYRKEFIARTVEETAVCEARLNSMVCRVSFTALNELKRTCRVLHGLAQEYVPNSPKHFAAFSTFLQATDTLKRLGLAQNIVSPDVAAESATVTSNVCASKEYRTLRNKYLAALATLADLAERGVPPGTQDYQSGVREGYRRASEIAILFLEDAQKGLI
jgi:hypothetical protein